MALRLCPPGFLASTLYAATRSTPGRTSPRSGTAFTVPTQSATATGQPSGSWANASTTSSPAAISVRHPGRSPTVPCFSILPNHAFHLNQRRPVNQTRGPATVSSEENRWRFLSVVSALYACRLFSFTSLSRYTCRVVGRNRAGRATELHHRRGSDYRNTVTRTSVVALNTERLPEADHNEVLPCARFAEDRFGRGGHLSHASDPQASSPITGRRPERMHELRGLDRRAAGGRRASADQERWVMPASDSVPHEIRSREVWEAGRGSLTSAFSRSRPRPSWSSRRPHSAIPSGPHGHDDRSARLS